MWAFTSLAGLVSSSVPPAPTPAPSDWCTASTPCVVEFGSGALQVLSGFALVAVVLVLVATVAAVRLLTR